MIRRSRLFGLGALVDLALIATGRLVSGTRPASERNPPGEPCRKESSSPPFDPLMMDTLSPNYMVDRYSYGW